MKMSCPRCKKQIEYDQNNPFRPFCSQRCRDIDFGKWIEGEYSIPVEDQTPQNPDSDEETASLRQKH